MKKYFTLFLLLINFLLSAQEVKIKAKVINTDNKPVDYFYAMLLSPTDSTLQTGGAFINGFFEIKAQAGKSYLLKISSVEYKTKFVSITVQKKDSIDLGIIKLENLHLAEVQIIAKRPIFKQTANKTTLLVKSSSLSKAGSLSDVLRRAPGVSVDKNNTINVLGRNNILIFINGREISNNNELANISSSNIKNIIIDKFPGAKYSADVDCVIKITTIKLKNTNLEVFNESTQASQYSNTTGLTLNLNHKKWSNYININIDWLNGQSLIIDSSQNYKNQENIFYTASRSIEADKFLLPSFFYGTNYQLGKNTNIQFQYNSYNKKVNSVTTGKQSIGDKYFSNIRSITDYGTIDQWTHNFDLIFETKIWKGSLSFTTDYVKQTSNNFDKLEEQNITTQGKLITTKVQNNSKFDVYTLKANYNISIGKNTEMDFGTKYSSTYNKTITNWESPENLYQTDNATNDKITAYYTNFNTQIQKWNFNGGVRIENTHTILSKDKINFVDSVYWNFFPSLSVNYNLNKKISLSLDLMRRISRPAFWQLDPSMLYFDSLSYRVGNPALKPFKYQYSSLGFSFFHTLNLSFDYMQLTDFAMVVAVPDATNNNIMKFTPKNFDKAKSYSTSLSYNFSAKIYNAYFYASAKLIKADIPFVNQIYQTNNIHYYIETSQNIDINKYLSANINFNYSSENLYFTDRALPTYSLDAGLQLRLFDSKLLINADINDMLHTSEAGSYEKFGYFHSFEYFDHEQRYFRLRLKYNFNHFTDKFIDKSANRSELNRI